MSDMVERVARALSIADGNHPDACSNDEEEQPMWTLYLKDARAAIEAMRQPTDEMINDEDLPYSPAETRQFWQALIDAALSPAKVDEAG